MPITHWSLATSLVLFAASAATISVCGVLLTARAERLARLTGLGQAILGAVFLGAITSLAGSMTSVTAALEGFAEIAFGNAVGGIAAQTVFLVIADLAYRKANLEHAAASEANLMQGVLLVVLLAIPLAAMHVAPVTVGGFSVASLAILAGYLGGLRLISQSHKLPMWSPRRTGATAKREATTPSRGDARRPLRLWIEFASLAAVVAVAGWFVAHAGIALVREAGLSETLVGTLLTSVATSLPELVIAIAAVRRGALMLAVGNILGGNTFDVLFLVAADAAYRPGSIYHAVSDTQAGWLALNVLLTGILLTGLLRRQRHGVGNIGFEGVLVLALYLLAVAVLLG